MIPAPAVPGRNTRNAAGENKGTVLLFLSPCFSGVQILLFPSPVSRMSKGTETKGPSPCSGLYLGGRDDIIGKISRTAK